jgi:hypothetical protein
MGVMSQSMFKVILSLIIFVILSFWGILLAIIPNDYWLIYGLQLDKPKAQNKIEMAINLVPQSLALYKVEITEDQCFSDTFGEKFSYISILIDISFNNFPEGEAPLNKLKAKELVKHFLNTGCSINEYHPVSGFAPIHSALLFASEDPDYIFDVLNLGGDITLPIQSKESKELNGMTGVELVKAIIQKGKSSDIELYKTLLPQLEAHNKQIN